MKRTFDQLTPHEKHRYWLAYRELVKDHDDVQIKDETQIQRKEGERQWTDLCE